MKKGFQVLYYLTVDISALVGLWHFFVPWMFQWYDYLPMEYENLIVSIDYTNYCFSLLLFGLSFMLIILGRRALSLNMYSHSVLFLFRRVTRPQDTSSQIGQGFGQAGYEDSENLR